jgi:peptidoglycan/xylan/chitin deacetylase (PgdA/CDA1 family)
MVSDEEVLHVKHLYGYKRVKHFREDLDFLLKNYVSIGLLDVMEFLGKGNALPDKAVLLTFDDGFREMYEIVAPILWEKGVSAIFFVNSGFVDNRGLCYQHKASILVDRLRNGISSSLVDEIQQVLGRAKLNCADIITSVLSLDYQHKDIIDEIASLMDLDFDNYLASSKPYLTSEQIEGLTSRGFFIGAHSIDHPFYSSLSLEDQLYQTEESIKFVREKFCLNYGAFAFPHGDSGVSGKFFMEIYASGLINVSFGSAGMMNELFPRHIQRFSLERPYMAAKNIIALQFARKYYRLLKGCDKIERE